MAELAERVSFLEGRVTGIENEVRSIIDRLDRIEDRINHLEERINNLELVFNQRLTALEEKFDRRFDTVLTIIGIGFSIVIALITIFKFI